MAIDPPGIPALLQEGRGAGSGFPQCGVTGHAHLQFGDTGAADGLFRNILGLAARQAQGVNAC
ncbi:hypothetical protein HUK65_10805 [Rhodobacteraceae bacterium 2376]|uniref:Uncharacterized protein n=1 Tax=Rhabdonatronobacter sediminivivens TaxID=2743469 RepID=A0A7Z0I041_9RHOB|nr:hypothetical protein [Rhabdonatronobacter sediminivivens]NYS25482.1 hypothetical protein [Rhabdonatronobacter sediminivivens]